ncbi:hypothetical protein FA10DRAFT_265633 [Acaromyces ingoldii]|uniref:Uncharacterized protein n=1 Tax=Acaromyces ingoldii TaxID=215250 RepID=A0A316YSJ1_9BASI|nr:hypothetical protein FA10DRAFT_265633 [Acaromyces ingoldii]PWN91794.1 hypothetical protein FA10DRAFT_265633 [Acaromyces ingoldii]
MVDHAYWNDPEITAKCTQVAQTISWLFAGATLYDFVLQAPFDWSILTGKRQRRWPQLAFFGCKILFIAYMVINFVVVFGTKKMNCQAAFDVLEFLMGAVVISCSLLLACRTVCVYNGTARTVVTTIICVFAAGLVAAWMEGVTAIQGQWTPGASSWGEGACAWAGVKSTYWVKYVITIVFDFVVLVLTTVGIVRMSGGSRIGEILIRHGLIYFVLTLLANLVVTILTALQLSPTMSLSMAVPQSSICTIASTRLYVMLAEEATPRTNSGVTSSQLSSGTGNKIASFFRSGNTSSPTSGNFSTKRKSGVIDLGATNMKLGSDHRSPNSATSSEDLEKSQTLSQNTVHIEQSRRVDVDVLPNHLVGHPFQSGASLPQTSSDINNGSRNGSSAGSSNASDHHADDDVEASAAHRRGQHSQSTNGADHAQLMAAYPRLLANSRKPPQ